MNLYIEKENDEITKVVHTATCYNDDRDIYDIENGEVVYLETTEHSMLRAYITYKNHVISDITYSLRMFAVGDLKIDWHYLSANPNAIPLLEENVDKIDWDMLSRNINAIHLLEQNVSKINWKWFSANANAVDLLGQNVHKIEWVWLSVNPNLFAYDKEDLHQQFIKLTIMSKYSLVYFNK
jgi:hypothetical protein